MSPRAARLGRGWLVGGFATLLAAVSHTFAGGAPPSALALALGTVFGGMLGTFALSARPSTPRLAIAVTGTQFGFHVLFSLLGSAPAGTVGAPGHDHAGVLAPLAASAGPAHVHGDSAGMWCAHAVAGLVTLALLRGAERAIWRMLAELARLVVAVWRANPVVPMATRVALAAGGAAVSRRILTRIVSTTLSRRGPPLSVAF
ncbi:MAG: hypothetical protein R2717_03810 [Schumannella sp.]